MRCPKCGDKVERLNRRMVMSDDGKRRVVEAYVCLGRKCPTNGFDLEYQVGKGPKTH